jgi:hypothetical protein
MNIDWLAFAEMMKVMKILISVVLVALPLVVLAQQRSGDENIQRIIDYARNYREHLPSLECDEAMLSQHVKGGKVKQEVRIKATLRELRDEGEPGGFKDDYTFKTVDGRPAKAHFKKPYFVYNVFANSLGIGERAQPRCFDYGFAELEDGKTLRFTMDLKASFPFAVCDKIPDGYHKVMLIDQASGAVRRVERSISPAYALRSLEIPYVAIDYAPQQLGDETFWLPVRFEASDPNQEGRMIATYSNFHRYKGVAKILP